MNRKMDDPKSPVDAAGASVQAAAGRITKARHRTAELGRANERLREEIRERIRAEQSLKVEEARLDALLRLSQMSDVSLNEIASFTLEQAIALTHSKIGFVGFLNEDESVYTLHAVSKDVVKECSVSVEPLRWHVIDAGIWADAIRERKTLFVDDYSKPHPRKKGLPPGHPYVATFMVVPFLEGKRIVAVAGVGNKATPYDKSDERQMLLLMSGVWASVQKSRSREELERAYAELEETVERRTAELRTTNDELNRQMADRRRMEAALRDSEERYRVLVDTAPDAILVHRDGELLYANSAALALYGAGSFKELASHNILKLVRPGDAKESTARVRAVMSGRRPPMRETYIVRLDGREVPIEVLSTPVEYGGGRAVQAIIRDITERRRAEEERRLQATALQAAANGIVITDRQGTIQWVNRAFTRLTGYSVAEAVGQNPRVLKSGEHDEAFYRALWETVLSGRVWQGEIVNKRKDGRLYTEEMTITPVHDGAGAITNFIAVKSDVTLRKQAEEQLRESERNLSRAQAVAHLGSWRLNVQRDVLEWSDESYRIFGIPMGTPLTYETFLAAVHPDDRESVDQAWQAALAGAPYDIEHRIVVGDSVKWVREQAELEFDEQGQLRGGFGTCRDITHRKQAQEDLERMRTEFLGEIGHELKTPLTAIKGSASMALTARTPPDPGEARELFEVIDGQADRLADLVGDLLDVTRLEAGTLSVEPEQADLAAIVDEAAVVFARSRYRHSLQVKLPPNLPPVKADSRRIVQVLTNLFTNAARYSPTDTPIVVSARRAKSRVTVRVRDRGIGIPADKMPLLFQKFVRLHPAAIKGTGLGLFICKGIVEAHGGRIWAESAGEGQGSTFIFTLPVHSAE